MNITFLGATGEVTGSCYLMEHNNIKFLVDFGLYQGTENDYLLNSKLPDFDPSEISFLILTHAHIDHCGRIPFLVKKGFKGKIFCTGGTAHLAEILLLDSANIMESDIEIENEKRISAGLEKVEPIFSKDDVVEAMQYFYPLEYDEFVSENGLKIKFINAGHLFGSASVILEDESSGKKICFSGDIGSGNNPLLNYPSIPESVDTVIMESTYGNRIHENVELRGNILAKTIEHFISEKNIVLIPAFAVGRVQELIYILINNYKENNQLEKFTSIDFYIDSPLSNEAKKIFLKENKYLKPELSNKIENNFDPFKFKNIHYVNDMKESIYISKNKNPKVIISSSGMCDGGRIINHIKELIDYEKCALIFVGYQGEGTLGRTIQSGKPEIKIENKTLPVKLSKTTITGFSGHGDKNMLLKWVKTNNSNSQKVFITHGEEDSRESFKKLLSENINSQIIIPKINETFEL